MKNLLFLFLAVAFFGSTESFAQVKRQVAKSFMLRGEVVDGETNMPLSKVNVEILGGQYTTTNLSGSFAISAKIGDELVIKSDDFLTVYYTIKSDEFITVRVENAKPEAAPELAKTIQNKEQASFNVYLDSAKFFLKKDAQKSIEFITKALEPRRGKTISTKENSLAFETLGDINLFWNQPDLAVDNYKQSLQSIKNTDVSIKLAKAFAQNKNYQESISAFQKLLNANLSAYQKVEVYEGLGDTYKAIDDGVKSVFNYQKALDTAKDNKIIPKITNLNSKIGEAYAQSGALNEAESYFDNSLKLAKKENKQRAVSEKNKVADFYNQNREYEKEIQLREETLEELNSMDKGVTVDDEALSSQRQNYKIANAFVAQEKYKQAIPYLEKSIAEADKKEDLIVQKDAVRKLSEIYRDIGEFDKATESYQRYVEVVDELYIKKEQEISQAARFSKEVTQKQNRIASLENDRKLNESRYKLAFENQELIQKNDRIQKWIIGSLILIVLLLFFAAYTQYKNIKQQKFANNVLALKSLRSQMNPHFIFNALNSVNSFIAVNDERAANKYLTDFSLLMRSVLENSEEDFIPLENEIELLELYVKLEHFRFKDKFNYKITVDEKINLNEFVIPPMLLQPYVENAVWHGLRYKDEMGLLEINFQQINSETIKISIIDDGIGRSKSKEFKTENQKKQKSKGMGNTQKRIAILNDMYRDKVDVKVENVFDNSEGTKVELILKKD
ncbi:putative regulator of cell autolysis [Aequorivita sublithincola DSM 14238]|uniref:Putative regulator of cell autolysis n=1 Tax=Aequorivita sublithincola (strain DSM 14238 / LMG 21431 / ACAM 643 / 9-3) TaxID=746697 RepID=I3YTN4_AEQSU|nr:histidine kinase [Aequorivita sublithincola]AFL80352.1 putative regulator of cell autolysis [Aequorivita sublithincola DSM 14238]